MMLFSVCVVRRVRAAKLQEPAPLLGEDDDGPCLAMHFAPKTRFCFTATCVFTFILFIFANSYPGARVDVLLHLAGERVQLAPLFYFGLIDSVRFRGLGGCRSWSFTAHAAEQQQLRVGLYALQVHPGVKEWPQVSAAE